MPLPMLIVRFWVCIRVLTTHRGLVTRSVATPAPAAAVMCTTGVELTLRPAGIGPSHCGYHKVSGMRWQPGAGCGRCVCVCAIFAHVLLMLCVHACVHEEEGGGCMCKQGISDWCVVDMSFSPSFLS